MKKILILFISTCCFFFLIYLIIPFLIDVGLSNNKNDENENYELKEIIKSFNQIDNLLEKERVQEFLNNDNLYENYSHNYTIKIPEKYKQNNGIGKYSSVQFYNEDLGFVVAVNVGKTNFGKSIEIEQNNKIIEKFLNELKNDNSLRKIFEESLIERGFHNPKLINYEVTNYNNRLFLKLSFNANRISDNKEYPVLITNFVTFYKDFVYHFLFATYQKESSEKWNAEIQKSMSNVMISRYIKEKN